MVSALEKYYIQKGYSLPKYSFINLVDDNGFKIYCAEVILPNGVTIRGEPKHSCIKVCRFFVIHNNKIYFSFIYNNLSRHLKKLLLVHWLLFNKWMLTKIMNTLHRISHQNQIEELCLLNNHHQMCL